MPDDVVAAERALQAAMLASDVEALDRLLHPDLLAVGPDGSLVSKGEDASGLMRYTRTWVRDAGAWRVLAAHIAPAT